MALVWPKIEAGPQGPHTPDWAPCSQPSWALRNLEELNCEGLEGREWVLPLQPLTLAQGLTLWVSELKHHQKLRLQRGRFAVLKHAAGQPQWKPSFAQT